MATLAYIKKPRITEKAADLQKSDKYVFMVQSSANKIEIKKVIEGKYKVDVVRVQTINTPGKTKVFRGVRRTAPRYKKAIVTVKHGQKIDLE